jgi:hypothetical protein
MTQDVVAVLQVKFFGHQFWPRLRLIGVVEKIDLLPLLDSSSLLILLIEYNWFKYRISRANYFHIFMMMKDWILRIGKLILFRVSQIERNYIFLTKTDWFNWFAHSGKRRVKWNFWFFFFRHQTLLLNFLQPSTFKTLIFTSFLFMKFEFYNHLHTFKTLTLTWFLFMKFEFQVEERGFFSTQSTRRVFLNDVTQSLKFPFSLERICLGRCSD